MASNRLWDTWMVAVGWILVVFGILLAFANQTLAVRRRIQQSG